MSNESASNISEDFFWYHNEKTLWIWHFLYTNFEQDADCRRNWCLLLEDEMNHSHLRLYQTTHLTPTPMSMLPKWMVEIGISKLWVWSLTFDYICEWEAKCLPVLLWPLWLLCWLGSGKCRLCDAVVSIIKERQPPPSGCYVGQSQRRLSVDGRDWWRAPGRASERLPHSGATQAAPPALVPRPPSWAAPPGAL